MEVNSKERWDKTYLDYPKEGSIWRDKSSNFLEDAISLMDKSVAVLDAGCGDGRNLLRLAAGGFDVTGIDFSTEALAKCRNQLEKRKLKAKLVEGNIDSLPFENSSFDAIICDSVFPHILEPSKVVAEFKRILKNEGVLILETLADTDPGFGKGNNFGNKAFEKNGIATIYYSEGELLKLLPGFKIITVRKLKYSDPAHGINYARSEPHTHESWLLIGRKKQRIRPSSYQLP